MQVKPDERWIRDTTCFWASDGEVSIGIHREPFLTAWWAYAYEGTGKLLLCTVPSWRQRMYRDRIGNAAAYA